MLCRSVEGAGSNAPRLPLYAFPWSLFTEQLELALMRATALPVLAD